MHNFNGGKQIGEKVKKQKKGRKREKLLDKNVLGRGSLLVQSFISED